MTMGLCECLGSIVTLSPVSFHSIHGVVERWNVVKKVAVSFLQELVEPESRITKRKINAIRIGFCSWLHVEVKSQFAIT